MFLLPTIADDDPLTDEELDTEDNEDGSESLQLCSCYTSLSELPEAVLNASTVTQIANTNRSRSIAENQTLKTADQRREAKALVRDDNNNKNKNNNDNDEASNDDDDDDDDEDKETVTVREMKMDKSESDLTMCEVVSKDTGWRLV